MQIIRECADYTSVEQEICALHAATDGDVTIDSEFSQIQSIFKQRFSNLKQDEDFEFTEWHENLRMLWVYLYSDEFYEPELIGTIQEMLSQMDNNWFAQFECSSDSLESTENPNGWIGWFLIFKDSLIFSDSKNWRPIQDRLGV